MKKKGTIGMILAAGLFVLVLRPGSLGAAPLGMGGLDLRFALSGNYVLTNADDQDNGFGGEVSLAIALNKYLSLELNGQFTRVATVGPTAALPSVLQKGHLQEIPVQLLVQLRLPFPGVPIVPYATAGAGISLNSFTLDDALVSSFSDLGFDITESVKSSLIWSVGAGVDFLASANLVINAHVLYRSSTTDATWTFTDQLSGEAQQGTIKDENLKNLVLGFGIGYRF